MASVASLGAETWVRGALTVHEVSGEIIVSELGGEAIRLGAGDVPVTLPGLVNFKGAHAASSFVSASNRSYIFFEGAGSVAVERFEQLLPDAAAPQAAERESGQSRMIVNFRSGQLAIDSRHMADASQYLVETPLGRITMRRALWQMRIEFDPRSRIFDFTITCSDGRVRFTDLQGEQYTLRTGQRLAGAGARNTPSIEVGENTDRSRERMERFRLLIAAHASAAGDLRAYEPHFQKIPQALAAPTARVSAPVTPDPGRRPIVIEQAKDSAPVTPFRGEVRPPSSFQADLF